MSLAYFYKPTSSVVRTIKLRGSSKLVRRDIVFEVYATAESLVFQLDEPLETNTAELDDEIFRMCDNIDFPLVYGGSDAYRDFRATKPFGNFIEGESVEAASYGGREEYVEDGYCLSFRFFVTVAVTISASNEREAQEFLEANFTHCFQFLDDGMTRMEPRYVEHLPAQVLEFRPL